MSLISDRVVLRVSRRDFLQISTGASLSVAVPAFWTASTRRRLRVGFVGLGSRGSELLRAAQQVERVSTVALYDPDDEALRRAITEIKPEFRSRLGNARDLDGLLSDPDIQALIISVPPALSVRVAHATAAAGKHAYIAPPLLNRIDELGRQLELIRRGQGLVHLHLSHPHDTDAQCAIQRAKGSELGAIERVSVFLPYVAARFRLAGEINALDFALHGPNVSDPSKWRSVIAEPRFGPNSCGSLLKLTPTAPDAPELTIDIGSTEVPGNPAVLFIGSRRRICCELKPQHQIALKAFAARALGTTSPLRQVVDRPLFAAVLAFLASHAMHTNRPVELQLA
jgi:hypothetical protein